MAEISELTTLARRRYPGEAEGLALQFFVSDRRAAGLGALDETLRRDRSWVTNRKSRDLLSDRITYKRVIEAHDRIEDDGVDPFDFSAPAPEFCTIVRRPRVERWIQFERRDFQDQAGRRRVAHQLRALRRATFEGA